MAIPTASQDELTGKSLYGDKFSLPHIQEWYESEVTGYFDLLSDHYKFTDDQHRYDYEYAALNQFHAIDKLRNQDFDTCLALGCAAGDDISPLATVVRQFIAIEPAEKWWRDEIGGKPARYIRPSPGGDIELKSATVDLATSFGVLHHIPNVSHVVSEIARVLKPGALFVLREPISSMGDWRKRRAGLTANERGLPVEWFEATANAAGFDILARRVCMFGPLSAVTRKLGISSPYSRKPIVKLDWLLSEAFRWNERYWRDGLAKKFAPSSAFWILKRE
jgi:SAM-dependent methyltransferase